MKIKNFAAWALILFLIVSLVGCGSREEDAKNTASYQQITAEEAKSMMEEQPDAVILDVREQDEYHAGHIPGAVLLPIGTINEETGASAIPEKATVVLVYCRSGNRIKTASQALADLGYTQIYEFGGIKNWPYEVER